VQRQRTTCRRAIIQTRPDCILDLHHGVFTSLRLQHRAPTGLLSKEIAGRKCAHVFERDPPFSRTEYNITTFQNVFANIPRSSGVALRFAVLRALSTRKTSIRVSRVSAYCHPHIRAPHPGRSALPLPLPRLSAFASVRIVPNALFLTS